MDEKTLKMAVPVVLIGGGLACIALGIRPKTDKEKLAENSFKYAPPEQSIPDLAKSEVDDLRLALNALRGEIRALWDPASGSVAAGNIATYGYSDPRRNDQYPWPTQSVGVGTIQVGGTSGYATDLIAPQLQAAISTLDVLMYMAGQAADLPVQCTASQVIRAISSLTPTHKQIMASIGAADGGATLKAIVNRNYEAARATEEAEMTQRNMPLESSVLAWIALNSPLSDMSASERAAKKELRSSDYRAPRTIYI